MPVCRGTAEMGELAADRRLAVARGRHAPGLGFGLAALLAFESRLLLGIALEHGQRLGHVADLVLAPGIADLGRFTLAIRVIVPVIDPSGPTTRSRKNTPPPISSRIPTSALLPAIHRACVRWAISRSATASASSTAASRMWP